MLTQAILKKLLHYSPETGVFTWLINIGGGLKGSQAGSLNPFGHRRIRLWGTLYYAGPLAYLYMTGSWPDYQVDHINRSPDDNRWENLRLATNQQNSHNQGIRSTNVSGVKGVSWDKTRNQWIARVRCGKLLFSQRFDDFELAELVVMEVRSLYHGRFAYHG